MDVQQLDQLAAHIGGYAGAAHSTLGIAELMAGSLHPIADGVLAQLGARDGMHGMLGLVRGLVDGESGGLVPGVELAADAAHVGTGGEQVQHGERAAQGAAQVAAAVATAAMGEHAAVNLVVGVAELLGHQGQNAGSDAGSAAAIGEEAGVNPILHFLHIQGMICPGESRRGDFRFSADSGRNGGHSGGTQHGLACQLQKVAAIKIAHVYFLLIGISRAMHVFVCIIQHSVGEGKRGKKEKSYKK